MSLASRATSLAVRERTPAWAVTWIEYWPAAVRDLSLNQRGLALTAAELLAVGRVNGIDVAGFGPDPAPGFDQRVLDELARRIDGLLVALNCDSAFVRLGSRSPKDTPLALQGGLEIRTGHEAVAALTAGSARVAFDLRVAHHAGMAAWVFVRTWLPVAWHEEWRCLIRRGRLVGAMPAQYTRFLPPEATSPRQARQAIVETAAKVIDACASSGIDDAVADLWLPIAHGREARLVELNPWGSPTDAGLFNWSDADLNHSLRWREPGGLQQMAFGA